MADKKPRTFTTTTGVTDDWQFYHQPPTGTEEKATGLQLVDYLNTKGFSDKNFTHSQSPPATTWNVTHNLAKIPNVVIRNGSGQTIIGELQVVDNNNVNLLFNKAVSGTAIFN